MTDVSLNLVVIRSPDIDRAANFYRLLGITLEKHKHGKGPLHYTAELGATIFEIYPQSSEADSAVSVRLGYLVTQLEDTVAAVQEAGGRVVSAPHVSEWGRRAIVEDPDGHRIELTERQ